MPLPIYTAFAIEAPAILGGSTQPTIMSVKDGLGKIIGAFVVKVFKWGNIEQYQPTNKEVYCNVLASSFDLETPFGALIHVEQYLIDELKSNPKYVNFDLRPGYYFGSKYLPNASLFQANSDDKLLDDSSLENIFAFDVLIRNMDRRVNKPNMLILKDSPVLIDHDIALQIEKSFEEYVELGLWNVLKTEWRKHLLLDRLQEESNKWTFDEFLEYLRILNLNELLGSKKILMKANQDVSDFEAIFDYLTEVKSKPTLFKKLLLSLVQ